MSTGRDTISYWIWLKGPFTLLSHYNKYWYQQKEVTASLSLLFVYETCYYSYFRLLAGETIPSIVTL